MPEHLNLPRFIKRYWMIVVGTAVTCCVLATTVVVLSPDRYLSSFSMYVMAADDLLSAIGSAFEGIIPTGSDDRQGYVLAVLHSSEIKTAVYEKFDEKQKAAFWGDVEPEDQTMQNAWDRFNDLVRIDDATSSEPIAVFTTTEDPELSFFITKTMMTHLLKRIDTDNRTQEKFLKGQLEQARKNLVKAAERFQSFQESSEVPFTVEAQGEAEFTALSQIYSEHAKAAVELSATERQLEAPGDVQTQLELTAALAGAKARAELLDEMLNEQTEKLAQMPGKMNEYGMLQRDITEKAKIVETLAQQYELAKFNVAKTTTPYRIIDSPFLPKQPVKKPIIPIAIAGYFIGFVLGVALSLLRENFVVSSEAPPP